MPGVRSLVSRLRRQTGNEAQAVARDYGSGRASCSEKQECWRPTVEAKRITVRTAYDDFQREARWRRDGFTREVEVPAGNSPGGSGIFGVGERQTFVANREK
jgi:hypothetical protein